MFKTCLKRKIKIWRIPPLLAEQIEVSVCPVVGEQKNENHLANRPNGLN
jgi:hypothetical protein